MNSKDHKKVKICTGFSRPITNPIPCSVMDASGFSRYLLEGSDLSTVSDLEFVRASEICPVIYEQDQSQTRNQM